jgi:hypothetical protein
MDHVQYAIQQGLLSTRRTPRIVDASLDAAAAGPITVRLPHRRESGLLAVNVMFSGTASAPTLLTGFTSLAAAITNLGGRVAFRFLDGTEPATYSTNATGNPALASVTLTIAGCVAARAPTAGTFATVAAGAVAADPPSLAAVAPFGSPLWLSCLGMSVQQNETGAPAGFSSRNRFAASIAGVSALVVAENFPLGTVDPSAWRFAAAAAAANTICVRGA